VDPGGDDLAVGLDRDGVGLVVSRGGIVGQVPSECCTEVVHALRVASLGSQ